jgi:hypothetical protein
MDMSASEWAERLGFTVHETEGKIPSFWLPCMSLNLRLEYLDEENAFPYLLLNTTSWDWAGDRSDITDITSFLAAGYLYASSAFSAQQLNVCDPVSPGMEGEIHYSFVVSRQTSAAV